MRTACRACGAASPAPCSQSDRTARQYLPWRRNTNTGAKICCALLRQRAQKRADEPRSGGVAVLHAARRGDALASSSSGAQVCPCRFSCAAARSKRSSARFRVMRPRYGSQPRGAVGGHTVPRGQPGVVLAFFGVMGAVQNVVGNFAAVRAELGRRLGQSLLVRAQYRSTIAASSMVLTSFII